MTSTWLDTEGGGIRTDSTELTIIDSTIHNNSADLGGGIFSERLVIGTSVISGNRAVADGGGVYVKSDSATLYHVTIVENKASGGGGLFKASDGEVKIINSIVADNEGGDCFGRLTENTSNLIADGSCFATLSGDPMLGNLIEPEDGSPAYYPLLEGSPAIDAAESEYCPDTDIVGTERPQGAACDIGAYEWVAIDS